MHHTFDRCANNVYAMVVKSFPIIITYSDIIADSLDSVRSV